MKTQRDFTPTQGVEVEFIYQKWFCYTVPKGSFPNLERNTLYSALETTYNGEGSYSEKDSTIYITAEEPEGRCWFGVNATVDLNNGELISLEIPYSMGMTVALGKKIVGNINTKEYKRMCRVVSFKGGK